MAQWTKNLDVPAEGDLPVFVRIAKAITDDIRRGRLRAGDALPGSRPLASSLGVHRNTVLAAYRELAAEGWITTAEAKGTFVASDIPKPARVAAGAPAIAARTAFELPRDDEELDMHAVAADARLRGAKGIMTLGGGVPDVRLLPAVELARAMRRVLGQRATTALSYGDPQGPLPLRESLATMLAATRGIPAGPEHVLVARGSQMGIDLVARTLIRPGDRVLVEAMGYWPAWAALRRAGAVLVPVPVDAHGIDIAAVTRVVSEGTVRGLYVTPHHQFPTTVTLAPARRLALLALAKAHRFFILEDDYDHEFHYEGRPIQPLASVDTHGVVVYVGTLSKVLAPGLRLGFVVAPTPLVERLAWTRRFIDRQPDQVLGLALADLLEDGSIQRHVRRAKRIYAERRAELASLLAKHLSSELTFTLPHGGTAIWAKVNGLSIDAWATRALDHGLVLQPARQFAFDGRPRPFVRLGFAQHDAREAKEAVRRLTASRS